MSDNDYAVKEIDAMEAVYGGAFKRARAELGVEAFGMAVIDLPPNFEHYPEHDHRHDGQEEVFVAMRGGGEIEIDGQRFQLDDNNIARVGWGNRRKIWPGPEGMRLLVLGGRADRLYQAPELSKLGEPDPIAST